ncbi:hypothetical protein CCACVL1_19050 [Corchorus capsularis]|uniref:DUF382 domain-containing protein n=1 Tax=Corchorus capsularis TaxID=210143 RepID=A0A1R3HIY9_COCAP|nr:hypothetical protein CCACVL1_19050 [Corchorus capsularis]
MSSKLGDSLFRNSKEIVCKPGNETLRFSVSQVNILNKNSEEVEKVMQEFKGMHFKDPQIDLTNCERMQPKVVKTDFDCQYVFHDAFFKYPTKPKLTTHGISIMKENNLRNTVPVPVPRHWCQKRKYLQGKHGIEKQPSQFTDFTATGIEKNHAAEAKSDSSRDLTVGNGVTSLLSPIGTEHFPVAARISFLWAAQKPLSTQPLDCSALGVPNSVESEKPAPSAPAAASLLPGQMELYDNFKLLTVTLGTKNHLEQCLSFFDEADLTLAMDNSHGADITAQATICAQCMIAVTLLQAHADSELVPIIAAIDAF